MALMGVKAGWLAISVGEDSNGLAGLDYDVPMMPVSVVDSQMENPHAAPHRNTEPLGVNSWLSNRPDGAGLCLENQAATSHRTFRFLQFRNIDRGYCDARLRQTLLRSRKT